MSEFKCYCNKLPPDAFYAECCNVYISFQYGCMFIKTPWWLFWLPKYRLELLK